MKSPFTNDIKKGKLAKERTNVYVCEKSVK